VERALKAIGALAGLAVVLSCLGCAAPWHLPATTLNLSALDGSGCVRVYLIGSRGSGEEPAGADAYHGLGPEVYQFSARFATDLKAAGQSYAYLANPYPAVAISPGGANADGWMWNLAGVLSTLPLGDYDASAAVGVADILAAARHIISACPDTHILLAGFSQGAQVSGDAYQLLTPAERAHVLGVFLLSDPRRNAGDLAADTGSASEGPARAGARPFFPVTIPERVRSYCQSGDPVCQGPFQLRGWHLTLNTSTARHLNYVTAKTAGATYPEQAADYFASLAGALLPAPTAVPSPITGPSPATGPHPSTRPSPATSPAPAVPGAPTRLTVTVHRGAATLTWQPPTAGPPAEGYLISTVHGDPLGETGPGEPRSITVGGPNLPLDVIVQSVNDAGDGGVSAPVEISLARGRTITGTQ
jgi:Cutinase